MYIRTVQLIYNLMLACTNSRANGLFSRSPLSRLACSIPLLASVPSCACARERTRDNQCLSRVHLCACKHACLLDVYILVSFSCIKFQQLVILVKIRSISTKIVIQASGNVKVKDRDLILESRKKLIALYS